MVTSKQGGEGGRDELKVMEGEQGDKESSRACFSLLYNLLFFGVQQLYPFDDRGNII
jgi:hypothetical protein